MTVMSTEVELRELNGVAELKRAEEFQRTVWGADDPADNSDLMLAIQHEGGLVAGAFVEGRMLGFLFAFPPRNRRFSIPTASPFTPTAGGWGWARG